MRSVTSAALLFALAASPWLGRLDAAAAPDVYRGAAVVRVVPASDAELADLANELAGYLQRIDTRPWSVEEAPTGGAEGLWLMRRTNAKVQEPFTASEGRSLANHGPEAYRIRANARSIGVLGNTSLAVQHGMFDLLERMGCRFLTPAEAWTVIPEGVGIRVAEGPDLAAPDFLHRRIWYANGLGVGHSPDSSLRRINETYKQFRRSTRQESAFALHTGHSYYGTYIRHRTAFEQHPEWARLNEDGIRPPLNDKGGRAASRNWCPSNPDLADMVLADRINQLRRAKKRNPAARMVSMDPNDGSRPCQCGPCQALGNATDQALHLANFVARGLMEVFPDALVGILIYPSHNLPPEKERLEPNVIPTLALAFNRSGLSYAELIEGWADRGGRRFGVYDYFGVYEWDYGMPAQSRVTYDYIRRAIPHFSKQWSVELFSAQSQASWGRYGPSMYLARKLLWEVDADAEAIYQEYFDAAFGGAAGEMRRLFDVWDTGSGGRLSDTNLARWLVMMNHALETGESESVEVRRRLEDMAAYLHAVVLYKKARDSQNLPKKTEDQRMRRNAAIQERVGRLLNFVWRTRDRQIMQFWGFMTRMGTFGPPIHRRVWKEWVAKEVRKGTAEWMTVHEDYSSEDIADLFAQDLHAYGGEVEAIPTFSGRLVPLHPDHAPQSQKWTGALSGASVWHIAVEDQPEVMISIGGGADNPQYFRRLVVSDSHGETAFSHTTALYDTPDRDFRAVTLQLDPGLYRVEMNAGGSYIPKFAPPVRAVWEQSESSSPYMEYFTPGYFYVPKGTDELLVRAGTLLTLEAPSWEEAQSFNGGRQTIPVGGDDGTVWSVKHVTKTKSFVLLNVPPYIANSRANLLVPRGALSK